MASFVFGKHCGGYFCFLFWSFGLTGVALWLDVTGEVWVLGIVAQDRWVGFPDRNQIDAQRDCARAARSVSNPLVRNTVPTERLHA